MLEAPCKDCAYKGCGVHHDECMAYQIFKNKNAELKETASRVRESTYGRLNKGKIGRASEHSPIKGHKY